MADFYSDFINWTTAGVVGGALLLSGTDFGASEDVDDKPVLLAAAADSTAENIMREAIAREMLTSESIDETAIKPRKANLPQIRQAKLEKVVFTAVGDKSGLAPIRPHPEDILEKGKVTAQAVNLRAGPGTRFAVVGRDTNGQQLAVTGKTEGVWIQILTASGEEGWVHGRYFRTPEQLAAN